MRENSTATAMGILTRKGNFDHMTNIVALLVLLGSENRLRILQSLADGPKNVTAITADVGSAMATTSQQLQHLLRGGLITLEKRATERWYDLRLPVHPLVAATLEALRDAADDETIRDSGLIIKERVKR